MSEKPSSSETRKRTPFFQGFDRRVEEWRKGHPPGDENALPHPQALHSMMLQAARDSGDRELYDNIQKTWDKRVKVVVDEQRRAIETPSGKP